MTRETGVVCPGGVEVGVVRPGGVKVGVASPGGVGWAATTAVPHGGLG